ncbi:MAG: hypothetical protein N838_26620 [Thiohalocapsa sp. PB-PSB1]|nr:MAG: hypothetical protein N838_26620 [Thiohalocapsa sp. PB-PSB1]
MILDLVRLSIVDRYFISEIAKVFSTIMATLMLVMTSLLFLRALEQVNLGSLASESLLRFLGLQILRDTASLLAPAFFISALVTLGRMARDSELIAFNAGGLGPFRIYRSLLLFAIPLSLITAWFALVLQPYASAQIQLIEDMKNDQATRVAGLQSGRFYEQDDGRITFYAAHLGDDKRFENLFIQDRRSDPPRIVLSQHAYFLQDEITGERAIVLEDGRRFDGVAGSYDYGMAEFARYTFYIAYGGEGIDQRRRRSAMPTAELILSENLRDRAEIGHRLSAPLGILTLALLVIPLTSLSPRQRSAGRLFLALLAYFAFFNLQRLAENWMQTEVTPGWLGMLWYQPALVSSIYFVLMPGSFWFLRIMRSLSRLVGWARPD